VGFVEAAGEGALAGDDAVEAVLAGDDAGEAADLAVGDGEAAAGDTVEVAGLGAVAAPGGGVMPSG